jgi:16S rRNA (cytidine1402-2'-O)-methyltransferase
MLSIVSTPIGNLGDITQRAKETLTACDAVICEDTRVAGQLLHLLQLPKKELISFHSFNEHQKLDSLIARLKSGEHLALISDAGTPGISDPGYLLVSKAHEAGIKVEVVPGPSAFLAALSISGLPIHHFLYLGFLPEKKGRRMLLESLKVEERTVVFYESPHRIERTLSELADILADQPDRPIVLCRELTKMHEEVIRTTIKGMQSVLPTLTIKGEFVIVMGASRSSDS